MKSIMEMNPIMEKLTHFSNNSIPKEGSQFIFYQ